MISFFVFFAMQSIIIETYRNLSTKILILPLILISLSIGLNSDPGIEFECMLRVQRTKELATFHKPEQGQKMA